MAINKYQKKYLKTGTHRIAIDYPISEYNKIKALADAEGIPVNTFIREAVKTYIRGIED